MTTERKLRKELAALKARFNQLIGDVDSRTIRSGFHYPEGRVHMGTEYVKSRVETATKLGWEMHVTVVGEAIHFDYVKKITTPCQV